MSRQRLFTLAMLKKLAAPLGVLTLMGAAALSSAGCGSTPATSQSTGSGGAGGEGGAGGGGGSTAGCTTSAQCPGVDTDCRTRSCAAGACGFTNAPAGKATSTQSAGDCKASVCDGMGVTTVQNDDADILDDGNDCTDDVCTSGAPTNTPKAAGVTCTGGGKVCDGASKCVECVDNAGCDGGVCSSNKCVPASCLDQEKNAGETDVDCGGNECNPCADGKICVAGTDCLDTICAAGKCAKATCTDTAKNGAETDIDCGGGACKGCGPDLGCKLNGDCVGGSCSGTICLPTCTDKVKNTSETDVDCGGPTCAKCEDTKACAVDGDCKSLVCLVGVCKAPSCTDGVKNGLESDKDCGGGCAPCGPTLMCTKPADCATGVCTGNVCQGAICDDGAKNGSETDVDCGGMCATKCAAGKLCAVGLDCASSVCGGGGFCLAATCGDGIKNGAEACDDGNPLSNDGCSSACVVEVGFTCAGTAPTVCAATCGDGVKVGAEQCDDANTVSGDGCSSACAIEIGYVCGGAPSVCSTTCGDGVKAGAEACDDGNGIPNDGCTACAVNPGFTCTGTAPSVCKAICGDGVKAGAEQCDDGNTTAGDGCSATCTVQAGYTCSGTPSVCVSACGDGVLAGAEQCDDNNLANGDCCSSTCQVEAGCEIEQNGAIATSNDFAALSLGGKINGFINPAGEKDYFAFTVPASATGVLTAQTIDNFLGITCAANTMDTVITLYDASTPAVSLISNDEFGGNHCSKIISGTLAPGKYFLEVRAYASAVPATFAYTLQASLALKICGNGIVEAPEQCDGGPTCAADCTLIPICGDGIISGAEICDDSNTVNGDGCSSACTFEGGQNEVEPNNTVALADARAADATPTAITGDKTLLASIGKIGDKDIVKVTVATAGVVRFETFENAALDCPAIATKLTLLSGGGTTLYTDTTSGIKSCSAITAYLAAGTYYLQAEQATGASAIVKYLLQAKFEANGGGEIEPNNTLATATPVVGADTYVLAAHSTGTDDDYYAVTVPAGLSIRAEIIEGDLTATCESNAVDSYLTLYDALAVSKVTDDDSGRGFCSAIDGTGAAPVYAGAHALTAGTYYLKVTTSPLVTLPADVFNYRLVVTVR